MAIEELQKLGASAVVSSAGETGEISITGMRVHPVYRQAFEEAAAAQQELEKIGAAAQSADGKPRVVNFREERAARNNLARAYALQAGCDLGLLETGPLPAHVLHWESSARLLAAGEPFVLVGLPFKIDEYRPMNLAEVSRVEHSAGRGASPAGGESVTQCLRLDISGDADDRNWSGSPVLNSVGKVCGVYCGSPGDFGGGLGQTAGPCRTRNAVTPDRSVA